MENKIQLQNGHLNYYVYGNGSPIIFIHGFTLDNRMWDEQVKAFSKEFKVVTYDVRGFGRSSMPEESDYTPWKDLETLIDTLKLDKPTIVGLSMGGRIASQFAVEKPDKISKLVLVDASMNEFKYQVFSIVTNKIKEAFLSGGRDAAINYWISSPIFERANLQPVVASKIREIISDYSAWHWEYDINPVPALKHEVRYRLNEIDIPTLVVVGENDVVDFQEIASIYSEGIKNSKLVIIKDCGHMASMERAEEFNSLLSDFLNN